jgi:hypothetical protein
MRPLLFWVVILHGLVVKQPTFWESLFFSLAQKEFFLDCLTLAEGTNMLFQNISQQPATCTM